MEIDILDSLEDLNLLNHTITEDDVKAALKEGPKNSLFQQIIVKLTNEIHFIDNTVNIINETEADSEFFHLELSSFLREIECPYDCLTSGPILERLNTLENRLILLDFLCTEVAASRINLTNSTTSSSENQLSTPRGMIENLMNELNISPVSSTSPVLEAITSKVQEKQAQTSNLPEFLLPNLSPQQWAKIEKLFEDFYKDYKLRKTLALTRTDVTIQSFTWSDKYKPLQNKIHSLYAPLRKQMSPDPQIDLAHLLIASEELLAIRKISTSTRRNNAHNSVYKIIMGSVPNRGGTTELMPSMPALQSRTADTAPQVKRPRKFNEKFGNSPQVRRAKKGF